MKELDVHQLSVVDLDKSFEVLSTSSWHLTTRVGWGGGEGGGPSMLSRSAEFFFLHLLYRGLTGWI